MTFSACSPLSSVLSTGVLDMDDYFDFDAASCDPSPTFAAMGSDSPRAFGKTQPSMDFVQSILEILMCQRDDTHSNPHRIRTMDVDIDDIFSGTGPCNDQAVGLPTTQWNPQACDWSDSESCSSAPGSPSSFLSTLSPPHTPISYGADSDEDDRINSSNGQSRASTSYAAGISNELATSSFLPPPRLSVTIPSLPSPIFVHAPRPVLSRDVTIVGGLEQIVQPPAAAVEREEFLKQESDMPYRLELPPPIAQPQLIHLEFLDLPPRTPSPCERKGPQHRIGKKKPGKSRKNTHRCLLPHCGSRFLPSRGSEAHNPCSG
ncbi:hypothetical protein B0H14DRAFT_2775081, partial [Mycena olivaceomarginata]